MTAQFLRAGAALLTSQPNRNFSEIQEQNAAIKSSVNDVPLTIPMQGGMEKMGKDTTCDWCGEWIYFVTRDGRQTPMQDGKPHRCHDHAVGSRFSVGARRREMAE
ncbi:MAG: hypothetical protein ACR2NP_21670, partial [Pirellulaceae bacterium]